jgi:photosystem II stability/assembly factor-like uncharacterized protein
MRRTWLTLGFLLAIAGCDDDDGGDPDSGTTGKAPTTGDSSTTDDEPLPYWAVGEQGEMLRIDRDGAAGGYPLHEDADLLAIDCLGSQIAWAAGGDGTVIRTLDAGETWTRVDLDSTDTFRGIRVVNQHLVYVVGDGGAIHVTHDGGAAWHELAAPPVDFSAVATDALGTIALVAALDGSIWFVDHEGTRLQQVHEAAGTTLWGISVADDGHTAVAVGEAGTWLESEDGGRRWSGREVDTHRDLHAVQVARLGGMAIAVGEAGVVVRVDPQGATVVEHLDEALSLHAVHASATGDGIAVGDHGIVLLTDDVEHWWPAEPVTHHALFGVDGLGAHPHL